MHNLGVLIIWAISDVVAESIRLYINNPNGRYPKTMKDSRFCVKMLWIMWYILKLL